MIEMERIQNLNLGQEADEKVEDDQRTPNAVSHRTSIKTANGPRSLASSHLSSRRRSPPRRRIQDVRATYRDSAATGEGATSNIQGMWTFYQAFTTTDKNI